MTAPEGTAPGQAAYEEPPLVYVRWCHVDDPEITDDELTGMWNGESRAEREFWRSLVPRELTAAAAAQPASGEAELVQLRVALMDAHKEARTAWAAVDHLKAQLTALRLATDAELVTAAPAAPGAAPELAALVRDMLQAFPDTADEQEWRDRAGALGICDPDGKPYRAYTEDDL